MTTTTSTALIVKDFNGLPITFREDGYINMTKAIQHFPGKQLVHFWSNQETDAYLVELAAALKLISRNSDEFNHSLVRDSRDSLVDARSGRYGGTFCHPKLAVFFARWLDVRFAVWCDLMIDNILHGNLSVSVTVPTQEAQQLKADLSQAQSLILGLQVEKEGLQKVVQQLQEKVVQEDIPEDCMTAWNFLEQHHNPKLVAIYLLTRASEPQTTTLLGASPRRTHITTSPVSLSILNSPPATDSSYRPANPRNTPQQDNSNTPTFSIT